MAVLPSQMYEQTERVERTDSELIRYLREELGVSEDSIELAIRHCRQEQGTLPMVLWRYGLVSIEQLNHLFDWMAQ